MKTVAELVMEDADLDREIKKCLDDVTAKRARRQAIAKLLTVGDDLDKGKLVKAVWILSVEGKYHGNGDQPSVIRDARVAISSGGGPLFKTRFGTKNYDRWQSQRSDHPPGYGPRHGSVNFSIGLTRRALVRDARLNGDEIEACLYTINCVESKALTAEQFIQIRKEVNREATP